MKLLKSIIVAISFLNLLVGEDKGGYHLYLWEPRMEKYKGNSRSMNTLTLLFHLIVQTGVLSTLRTVCGALQWGAWEKVEVPTDKAETEQQTCPSTL